METCEVAEAKALSAWLAAATPDPSVASDQWLKDLHLPRLLACGSTFDVVLADRPLIETAYQLLAQYEQPLGPAVTFTNLRSAAVLVPCGTGKRWNGLVAASQWPEGVLRPACLSTGHTILVPALAPRPTDGSQWLVAPDYEQAIGGTPPLTSPAPLARCLAEACSARTPMKRAPMNWAVPAVKLIFPSLRAIASGRGGEER